MKKKETKYSLEKEIREALASGRSQKSIYNTLKDGNDDSVLADKVAEYLPLEVRNKTKYSGNYTCLFSVFLSEGRKWLRLQNYVFIFSFEYNVCILYR